MQFQWWKLLSSLWPLVKIIQKTWAAAFTLFKHPQTRVWTAHWCILLFLTDVWTASMTRWKPAVSKGKDLHIDALEPLVLRSAVNDEIIWNLVRLNCCWEVKHLTSVELEALICSKRISPCCSNLTFLSLQTRWMVASFRFLHTFAASPGEKGDFRQKTYPHHIWFPPWWHPQTSYAVSTPDLKRWTHWRCHGSKGTTCWGYQRSEWKCGCVHRLDSPTFMTFFLFNTWIWSLLFVCFREAAPPELQGWMEAALIWFRGGGCSQVMMRLIGYG